MFVSTAIGVWPTNWNKGIESNGASYYYFRYLARGDGDAVWFPYLAILWAISIRFLSYWWGPDYYYYPTLSICFYRILSIIVIVLGGFSGSSKLWFTNVIDLRCSLIYSLCIIYVCESFYCLLMSFLISEIIFLEASISPSLANVFANFMFPSPTMLTRF